MSMFPQCVINIIIIIIIIISRYSMKENLLVFPCKNETMVFEQSNKIFWKYVCEAYKNTNVH